MTIYAMASDRVCAVIFDSTFHDTPHLTINNRGHV